MFGYLAGELFWDQIALSIFFTAIIIRDIYSSRESKIRLISNIIALIGCVLLAANGVVRPSGLILMGSAMSLFLISLSLHLAER